MTEIGTVNNYLTFEDPYFGEGQRVLDIVTPEYIHQKLMGYLLQVIARPKTA